MPADNKADCHITSVNSRLVAAVNELSLGSLMSVLASLPKNLTRSNGYLTVQMHSGER